MTDWIANGESGSSVRTKLNANVMLRSRTALSSAQIISLASSPVQLVAAQGAGTIIQPISCLIEYTFGTVIFGCPTSPTAYLSIGGVNVFQFSTNSSIFERAASSSLLQSGGSQNVSSIPASTLDNQPLMLSHTNPLTAGQIATSSLNAGGTGYAPGDTGQVANTESATYVVDTVSGGAVVTYHFSDPGFDYIPATGSTTSRLTGSGSGFKINVLSVTQGNGSAVVSVAYLVITR